MGDEEKRRVKNDSQASGFGNWVDGGAIDRDGKAEESRTRGVNKGLCFGHIELEILMRHSNRNAKWVIDI